MKDFWKCFTPQEFGVKFAGSRISATCSLGLCRREGDFVVAKGIFNGVIIKPKNNKHKGRYFEIFAKLDDMDKPMIEYTTEEKKQIFASWQGYAKFAENTQKREKVNYFLFLNSTNNFSTNFSCGI
jgi:inosine/xanthosine triphosphate pyrophosphatase family protein